MASTAAGVAVGSTVGHGLSNMLFGGGSQAPPAPEQYQQPSTMQATEFAQEQSRMGASCEGQSKGELNENLTRHGREQQTLTNNTSRSFVLTRLPQMSRGHEQQHGLVLLLP